MLTSSRSKLPNQLSRANHRQHPYLRHEQSHFINLFVDRPLTAAVVHDRSFGDSMHVTRLT